MQRSQINHAFEELQNASKSIRVKQSTCPVLVMRESLSLRLNGITLYLIWEFNWFENLGSFDIKQCKKPGLSSRGSCPYQQLDTKVVCILCDGCDWRVQILQSNTKAECSESLSVCRAEHLEGGASCQPTNSSIWSKMKNRLLNFCHGQILINSLHFYGHDSCYAFMYHSEWYCQDGEKYWMWQCDNIWTDK